MGTLFSALDIARAGLQVAQVQLDVTAHNIANVNKEGYSRQRVELTTRVPNYRPYGALGRGPAIEGVERLREGFLDQVYRNTVPGLGAAEVRGRFFSRIEDIFQEPGEIGFGTRLDQFFDALNDFSNNVEELPVRVALASEGEALANTLNEVATRVDLLRTNANEEVRGLVDEINSLAERIAALNQTIQRAELNGRRANDLRDDRDVLLDELAGLVNISYRERDDGVVDVLVSGVSLVNGSRFRAIEAVPDSSLDPVRGDLLRVRFVDDQEDVGITDGELYGAISMRDGDLVALEDQLDELALGLINSMNAIHSRGNGLSGIDLALATENGVNSPFAPLNLADLPQTVEPGSFDIVVYDSGGAVLETITVPIVTAGNPADQTNIGDIEAAINASANLSATFNGAEGTLTITPAAGVSYTFANDTSGVLGVLGWNGFFTGNSARDIAVNQHLIDRPELISSAFSTDPLDTGDNAAALAMAALRNEKLLATGTQTLNEFLESVIVGVGIDTRANAERLSVQQAFVDDFQRRRIEVSGVSLDEEVAQLILFERAFEASSRVITITDRMLQTLINIVQ